LSRVYTAQSARLFAVLLHVSDVRATFTISTLCPGRTVLSSVGTTARIRFLRSGLASRPNVPTAVKRIKLSKIGGGNFRVPRNGTASEFVYYCRLTVVTKGVSIVLHDGGYIVRLSKTVPLARSQHVEIVSHSGRNIMKVDLNPPVSIRSHLLVPKSQSMHDFVCSRMRIPDPLPKETRCAPPCRPTIEEHPPP